MKRFVVGDIHGRIEALKEVLKKSNFDYKEDLLIVLGDIVDGGSNTYEVVEELLKIQNVKFIIGNHDEWFMNHMDSGWAEEIWLGQGGYNTLKSYRDRTVPVTHQEFFNRGLYSYILDEILFVHGGFYPDAGIEKTPKEVLLWDRSIIDVARKRPIPKFKKVFVGHTTTQLYGRYPEVKDCMVPLKFNNLIMMDCGAGWNGRLAIMNIDTEEYWVSQIQKPDYQDERP